MKIDFTGVEGQKTFSPLPNGKYIAEVINYTEGTVKNTSAKNYGAPTISWELEIQSTIAGDETVEDRKEGKDVKVQGRKLFENMVIVEASFWRLKAFLEACGFDASEEIDFEPDAVVGSQLVVKLGLQPARKNPETGDEYEARNKITLFEALPE